MIGRAYYDGLAQELLSRLNRLRSFTEHNGAIGHHHEEILRASLRDLLSPRFALRTGFAFGGPGTVSHQGDILIVDENDPTPYLFREGDLVIVQPRALACVIEVKTTLKKRDFHSALRNLASFQAVADRASPKRHPTCFLFAFGGASFTPHRLDDWYKSSPVPCDLKNYPCVVYSMTAGLIRGRPHPLDKQHGHHVILSHSDQPPIGQELSLFLAAIRKAVELRADLESNPYELAIFDDLAWSGQSFRLQHGLVPAPPGEQAVDSTGRATSE